MIEFDAHKIEKRARQGWRMEHDINFWRHQLGCPFIIDDQYVGYFNEDKKAIHVFTVPLDRAGKGASHHILLSSLLDPRLKSVKKVQGFGDHTPDDLPDDAEIKDEGQYFVAMQIDLTQGNYFDRIRSKQRTKIRKSRSDYTVQLYEGSFKDRHQKLVDAFIATHDLSEHDMKYVNATPYFFEHGHVMEVHSNQNLIGFATFGDFLDDTIIFYQNYTNLAYRGVSYAVYDFLIRHSRDKGYGYLDLGYSMHKGVFDFKMEFNPSFITENTKCYNVYL